ncbi:MAG: polyketide biosynthesis protein [Rhodobacterales bacterium]|nr:MAG: polyketide biosynthesis protein [Rhodobacterales bacterium]
MVTLDIFSDPICPWCWIGKARLDRALERAGNPFQLRWHPFMLNPDMPAEGMDRRAYLEAKFGGKKEAVDAYLPVIEHAKADGLPMDLERITKTPSSLDAQRLILWAELEQCQSFVVQRLFEAYFRDGRDISDRDVLADIADGVGMDAAMVRRLLGSSADIDTVRSRDTAAREMGITSTPTFIVAGQHAVPGAQTTDLWMQVIAEIEAAEDAPQPG